MTSAQVVETSVTVTDNSPFQDYPHPDDHTTRSTVTPGFKPFTVKWKPCDLFVTFAKWFIHFESYFWLDERLFQRVRKSFRDCDWIKKFPYGFFMRSILSENLSTYEIKAIFVTVRNTTITEGFNIKRYSFLTLLLALLLWFVDCSWISVWYSSQP